MKDDRSWQLKVLMDEPTWLDFNFNSSIGVIEGNVSLKGDAPRAVFAELIYNLKDNDKERILYELGATNSFRIDNLPLGSGTFHVYVSPRAMNKTDFASARALMEHYEHDFMLNESAPCVQN